MSSSKLTLNWQNIRNAVNGRVRFINFQNKKLLKDASTSKEPEASDTVSNEFMPDLYQADEIHQQNNHLNILSSQAA